MSLPKLPRVIDVGELKLSRTNLQGGRHRYLIYLPIRRNYVWEQIYNKGLKVRVYLELVEEPEESEDSEAE